MASGSSACTHSVRLEPRNVPSPRRCEPTLPSGELCECEALRLSGRLKDDPVTSSKRGQNSAVVETPVSSLSKSSTYTRADELDRTDIPPHRGRTLGDAERRGYYPSTVEVFLAAQLVDLLINVPLGLGGQSDDARHRTADALVSHVR